MAIQPPGVHPHVQDPRLNPSVPQPGAPTEDRYFPKFRVIRRSTGDELDPTTTFTLLPHKDPHARKAIAAYCDSCQDELPGLARMLRTHFALE